MNGAALNIPSGTKEQGKNPSEFSCVTSSFRNEVGHIVEISDCDILLNLEKIELDALKAIYVYNILKRLEDSKYKEKIMSSIREHYPIIGILLDSVFSGVGGFKTSDIYNKKIEEYVKKLNLSEKEKKDKEKNKASTLMLAFVSGLNNSQAEKKINEIINSDKAA